MRIGYVFGGRYDAVALGGNAVDIREDVGGMRALAHTVEFRAFEEAPLALSAPIRSAKPRVPAVVWDTARDVALLRKDLAWRRRLLADGALGGSELVFEYWFPDSFGGAALARDLAVPLVIENLDPLTDERRAASPSLVRRRFVRAESERRRSAAALIVMSRGMGDYLVEHDGVAPERVHWLPQGVNTELFAPVGPGVADRVRAELGSGSRLVGFVGSFASYQRVDVLVEAVRLLRSRRSDVKLVLVGGTPERARALGAEDVAVVVPHVDYERVPEYVAAFDVAVLPDSNWYGSPVKVLEYAAVGVPVIGPDIGPVRDLMAGPDEGVLVPPGDVAALANAIDRTLDDDASARGRAERFGVRVRSQFDRASRTRRVLELCEELLAAGPQRRTNR